jgi:hypothetical protein
VMLDYTEFYFLNGLSQLTDLLVILLATVIIFIIIEISEMHA